MEESWKIYWKEHSYDTFLYGAKITFHAKDDVEYENRLLPAGTVIKQWYSKTNYQMQRIEPELPIIDGESEYEITFDMTSYNDAMCLLRLVFYDRFENEVGYLNLREKKRKFRCPLKTYSYRMQLIYAGAPHFHFHSVVIEKCK